MLAASPPPVNARRAAAPRPWDRSKPEPSAEKLATAEQDAVLSLAKGSDKVARHLDGKQIVKEIFVPGKLVNLVVR